MQIILDALIAITVSIILLSLFKTVKNRCLKYLKNNNLTETKNKEHKKRTKKRKHINITNNKKHK